jgi:hypothetical protein
VRSSKLDSPRKCERVMYSCWLKLVDDRDKWQENNEHSCISNNVSRQCQTNIVVLIGLTLNGILKISGGLEP